MIEPPSICPPPCIICIGEAIVDLVPATTGLSLAQETTFVKAAGGAPANVAAGIAQLGGRAGFVGMVGDDGFGHFLAETLAGLGVDMAGLRYTKAAPTALAVVSLRADGDRDFIFYGQPAAHTHLSPTDIDAAYIRQADIVHFGSISLIADPLREATLAALEVAQDAKLTLTSYDPNLRLALWDSAETARRTLRLGFNQANLVKISEEELFFLADQPGIVRATRSLWHDRLTAIVITRGARGSVWVTADNEGEEPGFVVDAVDTTGAGDAFTAALLTGVRERPETLTSQARLSDLVRFANAAGALATTCRGAIPAMPDRAAIEALLSS
jgi:fructokinase